MEIKRGQNIIEHEDEIFSRPKKTWFTTEKGKAEASSMPQHLHHLAYIADLPEYSTQQAGVPLSLGRQTSVEGEGKLGYPSAQA